MPVYKYRAATKSGDVVEYRTDAPNKFVLLNKIKTNGLYPISITSINVTRERKAKKHRRNIETSNSILKQVRTEQIRRSKDTKESWFKMADDALQKNRAVKKRDIVVFTQNLVTKSYQNANTAKSSSIFL